MGLFDWFFGDDSKRVIKEDKVTPVVVNGATFFKTKPKHTRLYRVSVNRTERAWWTEGAVYVLANDPKRARAVAERFGEAKGFHSAHPCISDCGKKTQSIINVVTRDNKITTLKELVDNTKEFGVIAYSSCREGINRRIAYEIQRGYTWARWS